MLSPSHILACLCVQNPALSPTLMWDPGIHTAAINLENAALHHIAPTHTTATPCHSSRRKTKLAFFFLIWVIKTHRQTQLPTGSFSVANGKPGLQNPLTDQRADPNKTVRGTRCVVFRWRPQGTDKPPNTTGESCVERSGLKRTTMSI